MDTTPNYMSMADFDRVIAAIPSLKIRKWKDIDIEYLFKILYHMALRPSEGIRVHKEHFDIRNRVLYLFQTKTEKHGQTTIPRVFVDELELYLMTKEPGPLFPGLSYINFWYWISKLGEQLQIDPWLAGNRLKTGELTKGHIFRKSWGKNAVNDNISIAVISKHLRHSKTATTLNSYLKADLKQVHDTI
jgi:integrase